MIVNAQNDYEVIKTESHISGLKIALLHKGPVSAATDFPVLFLHGSSFPSALAFGFRMGNYSWMDNLVDNKYDVYALDFLGYGHSDRYPEMEYDGNEGTPVGSALEVYWDVDKAVNLIMKRTGKSKVHIIAHSWGGSVAALYAEKFPAKVAKLVLFAAITQRQDTSAFEKNQGAYTMLTPEQRVSAMRNLTPGNRECQLEPEMFTRWGEEWLRSDTLAMKYKSNSVRFPSGPSQDIDNLLHGKSYYDPSNLKVPVLLIRGEWDWYPSGADAEHLFASLTGAPYKKYVTIESGTHVMHLEKSRFQLYEETLFFLKRDAAPSNADKHAIAVIFEVIPDKRYRNEYFDIARSLKPELEKVKGFISIERFQSLNDPEKILSLSFWENEEAIETWRNLEGHRLAQKKGRGFIFSNYRLRVAQVVRDYGMFDRKEVPSDSHTYHK